MRKLPAWGLLFVLGFSCSPKGVKLPNMDVAAWKEDKNGCMGMRIAQYDSLEASWKSLEGLTQPQVEATLGKPDQHELYRRSQKFFIYNLHPGEGCANYDSTQTPRRAHIRFNALGFANELAIRSY